LPPVLVLASTDITAFHIIGGLLALWAVILSALGVMREDFPGKGAGQSIVMAISALLVVGAVASAILTAKDEPKGGEVAGKVNKAGREGTGQPSQGGGTAPGTGANAGQQPGGQGQSAPPGGTVKTLVLSADPTGQLRFDKDALDAPAGNVRITMNNPSPVGHNIALEGPGLPAKSGPVVQKGGASEVEAQVKAGTYTFFCSVPGHRQAGMQGTLTVK
jgi:plastocyanin